MTRNSPRLSDETTRRQHRHRNQQHESQQQQYELPPPKPHSRSTSTSQQSHRIRSPHAQSSPHHHLGHSTTPKSLHKSSKSSSSSQNTHGPSPLKMVTTTAPVHSTPDEAQYYYLPDVEGPAEQHGSHAWMEPIVIDDDDLMFGGKSLSTWYEEERQSLSYPIEDEHEERRGRQRMRQQYSHRHHHHHQHHEHRHHHHPHHHMTSSTKGTSGNADQKRH
ncbi:hypothetical protein F4678DRAFT_466872 [Xylaria arbuscula]|nr:hypothetical protein F4678DRAFT_466872 [Xylaria arbuscula]